MRKRLPASTAILILGCSHLMAQGGQANGEALYLIAGTEMSAGSLPVNLYRMDPAGGHKPVLVRTLAEGLERVFSDPERRRIVVASPPVTPVNFSVVNMDSPEADRVVKVPYDWHDLMPGKNIYLLDIPGKGEAIALALDKMWSEPFIYPSELTTAFLDAAPVQPQLLPLTNTFFGFGTALLTLLCYKNIELSMR